jgi:two-component system LytT family response regulator
MQKIRCIIVEDEPLAVRLLSDYIQQTPQLELCGTFREAISAGNYLQKEKTDLVFLDIHLPHLKGLAFLRTLVNQPFIIVTTAYHQYAVEGFELNVTDYLMKPFSFERFITAVNKVSKLVQSYQSSEKTEFQKETSLFLTIDRKKVRIDYDTILYIESRREYVKVFTLNGEYTSKISTTELESLLPKPRFIRVHRSFIVSIDKINTYTKGEVEVNGQAIPIGKGYKNEQFFARISK